MSNIKLLARLPIGLSLFLLCLRHNPLVALNALLTRLRGKRLRAINMLRNATRGWPIIYQIWQSKIETRQICELRSRTRLKNKHEIVIYIIASHRSTREDIDISINSIPQSLSCENIVIAYSNTDYDDNHCLNVIKIMCKNISDIMNHLVMNKKFKSAIFLEAGDIIAPFSIDAYSMAFNDNPDALLVYADEDIINKKMIRIDPWFKPEWNWDQFLCQDYISGAFAVSLSSLNIDQKSIETKTISMNCSSIAYAILINKPKANVLHIPLILCHRSIKHAQHRHTTQEYILREFYGSYLEIGPARPGTFKIDWPIPSDKPHITVIIPTRDRLALLKTCLESLNRTLYDSFDIIVIDNESVEKDTIEYLTELKSNKKFSVIHYSGEFNFAEMNNLAAQSARGEVIIFVNNDIEFIDGHWMENMVGHAIRDEIGAVGAKLLYPDRKIQHAGVAIGLGGAAGHMYKMLPDDDAGDHFAPHVQRTVSAVTAACMAIVKHKFQAVGGFDGSNFAVAFNDVDLCLRLEAAGFKNFYTPHAVAIHYESQSRGNDLEKRNIQRYRAELTTLQRRWRTDVARDPNVNINLDYASEQMSIHV